MVAVSHGPFDAIRELRVDGTLPRVTPVRIRGPEPPVESDPYGATRRALDPLRTRITPGARIAVTAGSRGIHDLVPVLKASIDWLTEAGAAPFLVPAMGSHGRATAEGQVEVLAGLGVTEEALGVPIRATMDTVVVGTLDGGIDVHHDAIAAAADGVLLVNRVKPHTELRDPVASGLAKICAIGLGNHRGATTMHAGGITAMGEAVAAAARMIVARGTILGGLAIVENAHERTAAIELVEPDGIAGAAERALLERAAALMGRLPFDRLDVLVIDELGKDKSGAGMDANVIGRMWVHDVPEFERPSIAAITVHRLTAVSHGNASGLGFADVIPLRLLEQVDLKASYINALTAGQGGARRSRLPMVLADDEAAILGAIAMSGCRHAADLRLARIRDTLSPGDLLVSPALLGEVRERDDLAVVGEAVDLVDNRDLAEWPKEIDETH